MAERYLWGQSTRTTLGAVLPDALVVVPVGAVEQHGPHLPTATDSLVVTAVVEAASRRAAERSVRALVVTPTVRFGASDHHLPFGGTLSLTVETMTAVLLDMCRSIARDGGRRILLVNGHGGNRGPCHAAAAAASTRDELAVGYLDYWQVVADDASAPGPVPGHAGAFETSLVMHLRPELVIPLSRPAPPEPVTVADVTLHRQGSWSAIDGHTDDPANASAEVGGVLFERCVDELAARLVALAGQP